MTATTVTETTGKAPTTLADRTAKARAARAARPTAKTGDPTADRKIREDATAKAEAAVLNGVAAASTTPRGKAAPVTITRRGAKPAPKAPARYTVVGPDARKRFFVHDQETGDVLPTPKSGFRTEAAAQAAITHLVADAAGGASEAAPAKAAPAAKAKRAPREAIAVNLDEQPTEPEGPSKSEAKADLVRRVLTAIEDELRTSGPEYCWRQVFTPAEAGQIIANMVHHFPTGKTEAGARWWPEGMPRPDRSEWR